jgi:hypothetical protein
MRTSSIAKPSCDCSKRQGKQRPDPDLSFCPPPGHVFLLGLEKYFNLISADLKENSWKIPGMEFKSISVLRASKGLETETRTKICSCRPAPEGVQC